MNDKDKEAFEKWLSDASNHYADALAYEFERHLCFVSWQAAIEYKEMQKINGSKMKQMNDRIEDLLAKNKKLREALDLCKQEATRPAYVITICKEALEEVGEE
jgi:hypothetical protein